MCDLQFVVINGFQFLLFCLWKTIYHQSCGYCCGYVIILWIVDAILFQAECPKFCWGLNQEQNRTVQNGSLTEIRGNSVWRIFPCRTSNFFEQIYFAFSSIYLQIDKVYFKFGKEMLEISQLMSMPQASGRTHRIVFESWSWRRRTHTQG